MNFFFIGLPSVIPTLYGLIAPEAGSTKAAVLTILCIMGSVIVPYLLGSINPAVIISKTVYHTDVRTLGSGNAGSTNMLRNFGKKAAAATFLCDLGKAAVSVTLGAFLYGAIGAPLAGFFVMFGHMFPIFYGFRGGKGVACLAMVVLLESPLSFLILVSFFLVMTLASRMVSFGSVFSAILYPLILRAFANVGLNVAMAVLSAVFVVFMHRSNIKRIMEGKESKLDFSKKKKAKADDKKEHSDESE